MALVLNGSGTGAYLHLTPDLVPFYVGKGTKKRMRDFYGRNSSHQSVVSEYGRKNILKTFIECSDENTALDLEVGLIKCLKRMGVKLANHNRGGTRGNVGFKHSKESVEKMQKAKKGKRCSPATEFKKGHVPVNLGVPHSDETRKKISEAIKVSMADPARREINRQAMLGKTYRKGSTQSEETRRKISEANKGNTYRRGQKCTEEQKIRMSKAVKGKRWYNNGEKTMMCYPNTQPKDFVIGRGKFK